MIPDLRIVFLVGLVATGLLHTLYFGNTVNVGEVRRLILGPLYLGALLITVGTFFALLLRLDPIPFVRQLAYQLSFQQLVSIEDAIPPDLQDNLAVKYIERLDTDGDSFREWVVCYTFDIRESDQSPLGCAIYDNDRGNPPVIFPYTLRAPSRDYLSEDGLSPITISRDDVTVDKNGPDGEDLPELMVKGKNTLAFFRFNENSDPWDFPRDAPPRYLPIGFFRGSGGVAFDDSTKEVTVLDRDGFERSQLAVRSIFGLNPATNTYWDQFYSGTEFDVKLRAPVLSTIDFFPSPPEDVLGSTFPEKIVMAFYASTCGSEDNSLCRHVNQGWSPGDFLGGDALAEFDRGNAGYFGLPGFSGTRNVAITHLFYRPALETDPDLLRTGGGRDVVTGEEAQLNVVDVDFVTDGNALQTARYRMELIEGQWKIVERLSIPGAFE